MYIDLGMVIIMEGERRGGGGVSVRERKEDGEVQAYTGLTPMSTRYPRRKHICESRSRPATPSIHRCVSDVDIKHPLMQDLCRLVLGIRLRGKKF